MSNDVEAEAATTAPNGTSLGGRTLRVSKAQPRDDHAFSDRSVHDKDVSVDARFGPLRVRSPRW